jgi:hypothetical protein
MNEVTNVRRTYGLRALMTLARELVSYKLDIVDLQEIGKRRRGLYFFAWKGE